MKHFKTSNLKMNVGANSLSRRMLRASPSLFFASLHYIISHQCKSFRVLPTTRIPPLLRFIPADCSFSNVNGARLGAKVSPLSAGHWGCGTDLMGSDRRELISFKGDLICGMNVVTLNGHINDRYHSQTLAIHKAPFCWMHQCCVESHDLWMSCPCIVFLTS